MGNLEKGFGVQIRRSSILLKPDGQPVPSSNKEDADADLRRGKKMAEMVWAMAVRDKESVLTVARCAELLLKRCRDVYAENNEGDAWNEGIAGLSEALKC